MNPPADADVTQQLTVAGRLWTKLRRLSAYAAFDGWSLSILGGISLISGGYGSVMGLLISLGLLGTGLFEIRSVRQLRRLDPHAVTRVTYNQLVLAGVLILYAIIGLIQSRGHGITPDLAQILPADGSDDGVNQLLSSALQILYGGLIAFAILVQGGTALYYFSRRKHMKIYLEQTPEWIQQIQRERGEVSV